MNDIRYVCFSDMHFGAANSLLTNLRQGSADTDPTKASPVLEKLVECLRHLISANETVKQPTLILNGDILELALTTDNKAAMAFERFIELIMPAGGEALFNRKIIYIPGNHDHHMWETARETQYLNYIGGDNQKPGAYLDEPWHTTKLFEPTDLSATFMNGIIARYPHLKDSGAFVTTVYPNYGLIGPGNNAVIFSHGHFTESIYLLMSNMMNILFPDRRKPEMVWDIEAENFAWIDFFWSTMGRSGAAGSDVELIYDKLGNPGQLRGLINNLAAGIVEAHGKHLFSGVEERLLGEILFLVLGKVADQERGDSGGLLSPDGRMGLRTYLEGALKEQIMLERNQTMPPEVTFVFGHTHKPFEEDNHYAGYPEWLSVYNSGGWVVDTVTPEPLHGGAAILLDDHLNAASLRLYNECASPEDYRVSVGSASHDGAPSNPFYERLRTAVDPNSEPWKGFAQTVADVIPAYEDGLRVHQGE